MMLKTPKNKKVSLDLFIKIVWCVFLLLSFLFLSLLIMSSSPLNPFSLNLSDIDSSIFIYFGEAMHKGKIPYRDMFDHKGPLLWLIEYVGVGIGKALPWTVPTGDGLISIGWYRDTIGIWILETAGFLADFYFAYLIARQLCSSRWLSFLSAVVTIIPVVNEFGGGNYSEEWSLPFIFISLYIFVRYFNQQEDTQRSVALPFIYLSGLCCGCVICIRANNISCWLCYCVIILFDLLISRRFKETIAYAGVFISGVISVILPFIIYYAYHGAVQALVDCYIGYNISYTEYYGSFIHRLGIIPNLLYDQQVYLAFILLSVPSLIFERKNWKWSSLVFFFLTVILMAISGNPLGHYAIILVPSMIFPVTLSFHGIWRFIDFILVKVEGKDHAIVHNNDDERLTNDVNIRILAQRMSIYMIITILIYGILMHWTSVRSQRQLFEKLREENTADEEVLTYIDMHCSPDDSILVNGLNAKYYYASNRYCGSRRFIQHFGRDADRTVFRETLDYLEGADAPAIVIMKRYNVDGQPWGDWMKELYSALKDDSQLYRCEEFEQFVAFDNRSDSIHGVE